MNQFIAKHQHDLLGVLHGFDRLRFRGTLRFLANVQGLMGFLWKLQIRLIHFTAYAQDLTEQIRRSVAQLALEADRPVVYLNSPAISKEDTARQILRERPVQEGLICVLTAVEPCQSFEVGPCREKKRLELRPRRLKCLHQYLYFLDPVLGFGHLRLQTWFPFTIHVGLNGREWLCRQLDRQNIGYLRRENCVVAVEDVAAAQAVLDAQVMADWPGLLDRLAQWAFPLHLQLLEGAPLRYYWSADETEWASDLLFRSPARLKALYPHLLEHGLKTCSSGEVLRFLGRRTLPEGRLHGRFAGEVLTDVRSRPEGIRIKHWLNGNSIKMYDKQGSVLRVETTIVDARDIKTYRALEGEPEGPPAWRPMRKGVCDLARRAEFSQSANNRYLETMAGAEETTPLQTLTERVCRRIRWSGRSVRPLRPLEGEDQQLLQTVIRGEFALGGFRNSDLRDLLFGETNDAGERRRQSGQVTRRIRLLRAHGLIRKLPKCHRYVLTKSGRETITALLMALRTDAAKLGQLAV